jgi:predicted transcriptional regulator
MPMKNLTKAEEQIMQVLWNIQSGFVKDILEQLPEPKPAYNTVSTIVRILEKKGFVAHKAFGKTHEYFPAVTRDEYKEVYLKTFMENYFSNSYQEMVSFFARHEDLSISELEEIMKMIKTEINKKRADDNG